jgi:hypothetical protein
MAVDSSTKLQRTSDPAAAGDREAGGLSPHDRLFVGFRQLTSRQVVEEAAKFRKDRTNAPKAKLKRGRGSGESTSDGPLPTVWDPRATGAGV